MKQIGYIILVVMMAVLAGCRPRGVLSFSKMQEVLYDIHRTEAVLFIGGYSHNHDEEVAKYYYVTLEKYGITQAQFDSSLVWYVDHPQRFKKIYPLLVKQSDREVKYWEEQVICQSPKRFEALRALRELSDIMHELWYGLPNPWIIQPVDTGIVQIPFQRSEIEKK